jgi:hypothetical protein
MQYENTNFITAEPLIAEVKQELKSYFEAGAISEVLIPTFIDQALRKLKVLIYKPEEVVLNFQNYKSELPCDFALVDYALIYNSNVLWSPGVNALTGYWYKGIDCTQGCTDNCDTKYEIYETITVPTPGYNITMKEPKWIRVYHGSKAFCTEDCPNIGSSSTDIIQIHPNKSVSSTFESGCVYVKYFSRPMDDDGIPMIPEIYEVEEYIKAYLKFKFFETLWHSVVDESARQVESKLQYYKNDQFAKLQAAFNYLMTPTKQKMADNVVRSRVRFKRFHIS